ncbi:hypothetical protein J4410_01350 [Candidatus Woesearchaeota archaeon]|nr:hypothetical protein [Candidatus Woesearchaeota archaeon]
MRLLFVLIACVLLLVACSEQPAQQTEDQEIPAEVQDQELPIEEPAAPVEEVAVQEPVKEEKKMETTAPKEEPKEEMKKEEVTASPAPQTSAAPLKEGIVKAGTFHFAEREVTGKVELHVINGKKVLKLVEFSVQNENQKPIHVVLSGFSNPRSSAQLEKEVYTDLGEYVAGQDMYNIPDNAELGNFLTAAIYLPGPPQIIFGTAPLTPVA